MTQTYVDILTALAELEQAQIDSEEAEQAAFATQGLSVRDPSAMRRLVDEIDATSLSDAAVFPLLENATESLDTAEASLNKSERAL